MRCGRAAVPRGERRKHKLRDRDRAGGAGGQTIARTVAIVITQQACLAVRHGDGALVTGGGTGAAAVAFFLIEVNDLADRIERFL